LKLLLEQELLQKNLELESMLREQRMRLTMEMQEQTIFYLKQSGNPKSLSQSFDDMQKDKDNLTLSPSSDDISRDSYE
jgi:hypothetical protein